MTTATHYARAIDRYSAHLDALDIDRDELMLELLYRADAAACGRGWKGTKGSCVRKNASELDTGKASLKNLSKGGAVDKGRKERRARIAQLKAKMAGKAAPAESAPRAKKLTALPGGKASAAKPKPGSLEADKRSIRKSSMKLATAMAETDASMGKLKARAAKLKGITDKAKKAAPTATESAIGKLKTAMASSDKSLAKMKARGARNLAKAEATETAKKAAKK